MRKSQFVSPSFSCSSTFLRSGKVKVLISVFAFLFFFLFFFFLLLLFFFLLKLLCLFALFFNSISTFLDYLMQNLSFWKNCRGTVKPIAGICLKVVVIERPEFELANFYFAVQHFNHNTSRTPLYYYSRFLFIQELANCLTLESEWQQVSRTLRSILSKLRNSVVCMVSVCPPIFNSSSSVANPLDIVPSAPLTIDIVVTFKFHSLHYYYYYYWIRSLL